MTLATSAGTGWLGRLSPSHLIYVDASLRGQAVTAPSGRPARVPSDQLQGHGDPGAWPFVAVWMAAAAAAAVACWQLWSRWGILQTWFVGAPVLFGVLWGLSTEVMRLLPNVY